MLSSVLKSKHAVAAHIEIVRTFVKIRHTLSEHAELSKKPASLEKKYDAQLRWGQ